MNAQTEASRYTWQNVIAFKFCVGERVRIEAIEVWGRVDSCLMGASGRKYFVTYFDEDKVRREEWMYEDELSKGRG